MAFASYRVVRGDTAGAIAAAHGLTFGEFAGINPGQPASGNWDRIEVGEVFNVTLIVDPAPGGGFTPQPGADGYESPPPTGEYDPDRPYALVPESQWPRVVWRNAHPFTIAADGSLHPLDIGQYAPVEPTAGGPAPEEDDGFFPDISIPDIPLGPVDDILGAVWGATGDLGQLVGGIAAELTGIVSTLAQDVIPTLAELGVAALSEVGDVLGFVGENMAELGDVGGMLDDVIGGAMAGGMGLLVNLVSEGLGGVLGGAAELLARGAPTIGPDERAIRR